MKYFAEYYSKLSPYVEFDPNAFIGDDHIPQELCSFVLALALVYNDYKYHAISIDMILKSAPEGNLQRSPAWGEYMGIKFYMMRLHFGFVHEIFQLIQKNKRLLEHPFFLEVIRVLNKTGRKSWHALVDVALTNETVPKKSNPLHMVRNKVAFHYDTKELLAGYKNGFFEDGKILENACISRGNTLEESRFYFADKAIQGYIEKGLDTDVISFLKSFEQIMHDINIALYNICVTFIQRRNFAWKEPSRCK